ncbi:MAG TPA: tol-pal system protein YbgF [Usitatibacter sp.]|jgi:tol-pal system protein YbgF|nr:tol-pal system protein YbgF [Usitatibacter sp.]
MRANRLAAAAALILAAATLPARAGLFDDAEARRQIDELRRDLRKQGDDNEARIAKLEEQIRSIGVVELVRSIDELNQEIARLHGQIEVLQNDNQQLQKRQRDFYLDIDSRLKRLEGSAGAGVGTSTDAQGASGTAGASGATGPTGAPGTAGTPTTPGTAGAAAANAAPGAAPDFGPAAPAGARPASRDDQAREMKAYDAASNLFRRNDFAAAIQSFRAFLHDYPSSALAPNANYWIGISYANMRDYRSALAAQGEVLSKFPQSPKAPDAMLAIAAVHADQGDSRSARNTYEDIIARYPQSEAAGKARTRLAALRAR